MGDVNVFYFERTPGHTSIPRDGFNTIGMEMRHSHQEKLKFNLQKDIFVRRKLFNNGQIPGNQSCTNNDPDENISVPECQPSPATKRRHSQAKLDVGSAHHLTSNPPVSPHKQQKSHPASINCVSTARKLLIGDSDSDPSMDDYKAPSSYLTKPDFKSDNHRNGKISKIYSTVNISSTNQSSEYQERKTLCKFQSAIDMISEPPNLPVYETPPPRFLTPMQRGSCSPPVDRAKGECGTRGMTPLSAKARFTMLKSHGIFNIDKEEAEEIKQIRASRETCGCSCKGSCNSETCECVLNEIECQVERDGFPCSCGPGCGNPLGRKVFDETEVNMHYINTMMNVKTLL